MTLTSLHYCYWGLMVLLWAALGPTSTAFAPTFLQQKSASAFVGLLKAQDSSSSDEGHRFEEDEDEDDEEEDEPLVFESLERPQSAASSPEGPWQLENDFYSFLNQCSIQSFMFLLKSMRDPQTVLWMENFTQPAIPDEAVEKPPLSIGAVGGGDMGHADTDDSARSSSDDCKLLNYHGLNAMNMTRFPTWDSYFIQMMEAPVETYTVESFSAYIPDYDMEIHPPRLCNRLIAVREQIAREFAHDLQVLSRLGEETIKAYWKSIQQGTETTQDPDNKDGREIEIEAGNLMFLDLSIDSDYEPSPLRKGNFDLLKLLATKEAIHRILNDPHRQEGPEAAANEYLGAFYASRMLTYFDGPAEYGTADKIVHELLAAPPVLQQFQAKTALVDPTRLAEMILEQRRLVSLDWAALARRVPDEHVVVRRLQLDQLILGSGDGSSTSSFEQALKAGSGQVDTSATVPFFVPPAPQPELVTSSTTSAAADKKAEAELVAFGMNTTSVFE